MKKLIVFFVFINSICIGNAQQTIIKGQVPEIKDGKILLLARNFDGVDTLGRAKLVDNSFVLETDIDQSYVATLQLEGYGGGFMIIVEPNVDYKVTLLSQGPVEINGGKQQAALSKYETIVETSNKQLKQIRTDIAEAEGQRRFKSASLLKQKLDSVLQTSRVQLATIVEEHRGTTLAAYLITEGIQPRELRAMEQRFEQLNEAERNTQPGKIYSAQIGALKTLNVGSLAPDFKLEDPNGKAHSLHETEGKIKILDFWASWCGPCRMENPNMVRLYNDYKELGLTVTSVSLDVNSSAWNKAIKDDGLPWLQLLAPEGWKSDVVKLYFLDAVPTIYILDSQNRILAKNLRSEQLREFVKNYLGQ